MASGGELMLVIIGLSWVAQKSVRETDLKEITYMDLFGSGLTGSVINQTQKQTKLYR